MDNWSPLEWARYYHNQHNLCVIKSIEGRPQVEWKHYHEQQVRPTEQDIESWFRGESFRKLQIYVVCGLVSGVVALDCDSPEAEEWWRDLLGADLLDNTARSLSGSGRGHHFWFTLEPGRPQEGRSAHRGSMKWDLRGEGGGVVVPASPHRSGGRYVWERPLEHIKPWPYPEIPGKGLASHEGGERSSSLAWLLANPGDGGRNNWVTAVLGHYAKNLRFEDGYRATAELIYDLACSIPSDHTYERAEFDATVDSVWGSEKRKFEVADFEPTEATGFLSSGGNAIYTLCRTKDEGETLKRFTNFDLFADYLIEDVDGRTTYIVNSVVETESGDVEREGLVLPGQTLGSADQLNKWLASHRMVTLNPNGDVGQRTSRTTRFQMYLESQDPRHMRSSPWMGWYDDDRLGSRYVTGNGLIDATGLVQFDKVGLVPDPRKMTGESQWHYGFGPQEQAQAILREVLSFHDSVATTVFGSVWALAPIKGAVMGASSLFPHMAIVAPSEAGKTNGFFDLMLQCNGRLSVGGTYTAASLRDDLSRHRGGFVWIDDPSNIDDIGDLLRAAAGEGIHSRKGGANWSEVIQTHLVAPIVLSAEGIEMLKERAMADRVVQLQVPSPTSRQSQYGDYPQWDDIMNLMNRVGHLSRFAGNYVQMAFQWLDSIGGMQGLREMSLDLRLGSGRLAEKIGMVRAGSRCLQYMVGESWSAVDVDGYSAGGCDSIDILGIVDSWAMGEVKQAKTGPYLVSVVIPTYLAQKGYIPTHKNVPNDPVFIDSVGQMRVNVAGLAQWWMNYARGRSDRDRAQQLGAPAALKAEAQALDWAKGSPVKGKRYQYVDVPTAERILDEAGYTSEDAIAEALKTDT